MRFVILKIIICIVVAGMFTGEVCAQAIDDTNYWNEVNDQQRLDELTYEQSIDENASQRKHGYQYDSFEQQKELIFRQLEIITGDEETRYIIVPGDTMTIAYIDRGQKKGAVYKVSSEGKIHLPLIGVVQVKGLNRRQARAVLTGMFKEYIRYPRLDLTVNTSGRFMVLGSVANVGLFYLQPNLTVMEAILKAGSYVEDDANLKSVMLMRGGLEQPIVKRLNLLKMIQQGDRTDDILVKPGDLIYVPDKFVVNIEKFTEKVYRWVSAYYGLGRLPASPAPEGKQPMLWGQ